jgi:hypothetical protein
MKKFIKGQKVFSTTEGKGTVIDIDDTGYPVCCTFKDDNRISFTSDGKHYYNSKYKALFHSKKKALKYTTKQFTVLKPLVFAKWLDSKDVSISEYVYAYLIEHNARRDVSFKNCISDLNMIISNKPEYWFTTALNFSNCAILNIVQLNKDWIDAVNIARKENRKIKFE